MTQYQYMKNLEAIIKNQSDNALYDWNYNYLVYNKKRYDFELKKIKRYYHEDRILEIGAAPYHLTYILKQYGYPVTAVDIEPNRFWDFIEEQGLNVIKCNIEASSLPFDRGEFGFVLFNEVFEHLRFDPIATLMEINRVLKPGGILMLSTPNLYSIRNVINYLLGKGFDNPYEEFKKLHTIGHMGHVREYSVRQIKTFLLNTGFENIEAIYKSYVPLKGMWTPFNLVRKIIPQFAAYQVHFCKKVEAKK